MPVPPRRRNRRNLPSNGADLSAQEIGNLTRDLAIAEKSPDIAPKLQEAYYLQLEAELQKRRSEMARLESLYAEVSPSSQLKMEEALKLATEAVAVQEKKVMDYLDQRSWLAERLYGHSTPKKKHLPIDEKNWREALLQEIKQRERTWDAELEQAMSEQTQQWRIKESRRLEAQKQRLMEEVADRQRKLEDTFRRKLKKEEGAKLSAWLEEQQQDLQQYLKRELNALKDASEEREREARESLRSHLEKLMRERQQSQREELTRMEQEWREQVVLTRERAQLNKLTKEWQEEQRKTLDKAVSELQKRQDKQQRKLYDNVLEELQQKQAAWFAELESTLADKETRWLAELHTELRECLTEAQTDQQKKLAETEKKLVTEAERTRKSLVKEQEKALASVTERLTVEHQKVLEQEARAFAQAETKRQTTWVETTEQALTLLGEKQSKQFSVAQKELAKLAAKVEQDVKQQSDRIMTELQEQHVEAEKAWLARLNDEHKAQAKRLAERVQHESREIASSRLAEALQEHERSLQRQLQELFRAETPSQLDSLKQELRNIQIDAFNTLKSEFAAFQANSHSQLNQNWQELADELQCHSKEQIRTLLKKQEQDLHESAQKLEHAFRQVLAETKSSSEQGLLEVEQEWQGVLSSHLQDFTAQCAQVKQSVWQELQELSTTLVEQHQGVLKQHEEAWLEKLATQEAESMRALSNAVAELHAQEKEAREAFMAEAGQTLADTSQELKESMRQQQTRDREEILAKLSELVELKLREREEAWQSQILSRQEHADKEMVRNHQREIEFIGQELRQDLARELAQASNALIASHAETQQASSSSLQQHITNKLMEQADLLQQQYTAEAEQLRYGFETKNAEASTHLAETLQKSFGERLRELQESLLQSHAEHVTALSAKLLQEQTEKSELIREEQREAYSLDIKELAEQWQTWLQDQLTRLESELLEQSKVQAMAQHAAYTKLHQEELSAQKQSLSGDFNVMLERQAEEWQARHNRAMADLAQQLATEHESSLQAYREEMHLEYRKRLGQLVDELRKAHQAELWRALASKETELEQRIKAEVLELIGMTSRSQRKKKKDGADPRRH